MTKNKNYTIMALVLLIILFLFTSFGMQIKYQAQSPELNILINSLLYLEARANGANSPNKFESIENLKTAISNDDNIVEDLRQRGIISNYSLYSDLKSFRDSEKVISLKYDDMWIDYSKQKIVDNIYEVPVSEIVCTRLNIRLKRANTKCLDNIVQIRLKGV